MAQGFVQLAADSTGKKIDTQVTTTATQHRQVMVIGAKDTDANVAPVDATKGLAVDLSATGANSTKLLVTPDLPTGASTAAKQPALGTAGTASADVITVQGIASGTAQPVSGTVTSNAGTNLNTSALALETGGNLATVAGAITAAKAQVQQNSATVPAATTMQNAAGTGNPSGTSLPVTGYATAILNIVSGTPMSGGTTINFEASVDDTTWVSITGHQIGAVSSQAITATADGDWRFNVSGYKSVRARISAWSAGVTTVKGYTTPLSAHPTVVSANLSAGTNVIGHVIADSGSTTAVTGTVAVTESGTWTVGSSTATGSAVPANAMYAGVNAQTALPTAATAGNLTGVTSDKFGRTVVLPGTIRDLVGTQTTTIAASTSETTIVTAAASVFNDLTALVVSNTSGTAARVDFRDTTAGSILFSLYIPAGDVRGVSFSRPVPQTSVNTNWTAQSSASITDLRIYAVFDKNK